MTTCLKERWEAKGADISRSANVQRTLLEALRVLGRKTLLFSLAFRSRGNVLLMFCCASDDWRGLQGYFWVSDRH